jgi:NAD(P)-dependent dehydrogenase (short-subunit alcohol dehydrogenase family)
MGLLTDKVAIVTGAGRGIGASVALAFAREGAKVVVNDLGCELDGSGRSTAPADAVVAEIRESGGAAEPSYESVASEDGARAIVEAALAKYGQLDVLVNNAGILENESLLKLELADFLRLLEVELGGTFSCTRAAALAMRAHGGSIINTSSVAGMLGNFGQAGFAAASAGIYGLTRTASIELQRYGIRVNAVVPIAKTRMTEALPMFEKIGDTLSPSHVAPAHVFLASELASTVTGSVLSVAGGRLSAYKVVESAGKYKEADGGVWTAREVAEYFDVISKI